jgi:aspartate aminotransferase
VIKAATNLQSHATSNVSNVSQAAALAAVSGDLSAVAEMRAAFDRRRQTIVRMLNEIPGVSLPGAARRVLRYPSVKGVLGKEIAGKRPQTSAELAALILDEAEVAVVPGEAFGTRVLPAVLRAGDADLEEGVSRIGQAARGSQVASYGTRPLGADRGARPCHVRRPASVRQHSQAFLQCPAATAAGMA